LLNSINGLLTDSNFGLEEIKTEVSTIEGEVLDSTHGLLAIKTAVTGIEGIPASTQAQIDDIQNQINSGVFGLEEIKTEVKNLEDTQYLPFKITGPSGNILCDAAGGGIGSINMLIQSSTNKDFVVTSVIWRPTGVNAASDIITVTMAVDDLSGWQSNDLTGSSTANPSIDFTQIPRFNGVGNFPDQLVASGSIGSGENKDLRLTVQCDAGTSSTSIEMLTNFVHVSGWKLKGDTITITATKIL